MHILHICFRFFRSHILEICGSVFVVSDAFIKVEPKFEGGIYQILSYRLSCTQQQWDLQFGVWRQFEL